MLSRSSALKGQFCLPERKKKCKGQVNNLRISYTFYWEKKSIFYLCAISLFLDHKKYSL